MRSKLYDVPIFFNKLSIFADVTCGRTKSLANVGLFYEHRAKNAKKNKDHQTSPNRKISDKIQLKKQILHASQGEKVQH